MANSVNSYLDKYKGATNDRLSVYEILQKVGTTEYRNGSTKTYEAVGIEYVNISGNKFNNYGQYQFIWEKTFVKSPERSSNGSLGNLNSYATFLTPHLIIDFSIMSIDDYRKIMLLHYGANEFTVECYDPIYNRQITVKMYFATEEMAKLYTIAQNRLLPNGQWEEWVDLVGVNDYKVELIGTNNDLDLVSVKYEYSTLKADGTLEYPTFPDGSPANPQYEEDVYIGDEILVGGNSTFPDTPPSNSLKFKHWVDDRGLIYTNGVVVTVNAPLTLYAVWETSTTKTLSFNYGLSDVSTELDSETGVLTQILDREVKQGQSIGTLPTLTKEPSELYNGKLEYPYTNGGWYKHPVKQANMQVFSNDLYWTNRDTIIYALYDKKPFSVTYVTNDPTTAIPNQTLYYGDSVYLPTLARDGYNFKGWFIDAELKKPFDGSMPPYSLYLFAGWELKK
ncbi:MAG: InlB B-repeat-containing protein [Prevotella sp.]|nr:InlB B-repeat-containing protein [Prevotella sp.]